MTSVTRRPAPEAGFTMVEVMVALIVLTVGVLALMAGSVSVSRSLRGAGQATRAAQAASSRLEAFRRIAYSTATRCTNLANGTGTATANGLTESWRIENDGPNSLRRRVTVAVSYQSPTGVHVDSVATLILC